MDAVFVKENMRINWASEAGMVENIQQVIKEYKDTRKLQVLLLFIHQKFPTGHQGVQRHQETTGTVTVCNMPSTNNEANVHVSHFHEPPLGPGGLR